MVFSLGAVPHTDILHSWATTLLSAANIQLPSDPRPTITQDMIDQNPNPEFQGAVVDEDGHGLTDTMGFHYEYEDDKGNLGVTPPATLSQGGWSQLLPQLISSLLFAFCYKQGVTDQRDKKAHTETLKKGPDNPGNTFHHGLCGCCSNCAECWCALYCPGIKFADAHTLVTGNFWQSFFTYVGVQFLNALVACVGAPIVYPPPMYIVNGTTSPEQYGEDIWDFVMYFGRLMIVVFLIAHVLQGLYFGCVARKALREALGAEVGPDVMATDCLAWSFCSWCALSQEAVEVDIATDVKVGCPCSIQPRQKLLNAREVAPCDYEKLLGDAVVLEEGGR